MKYHFLFCTQFKVLTKNQINFVYHQKSVIIHLRVLQAITITTIKFLNDLL